MDLMSTAKGWGESQETGKHLACQISGAGLDCRVATKKSLAAYAIQMKKQFSFVKFSWFPSS